MTLPLAISLAGKMWWMLRDVPTKDLEQGLGQLASLKTVLQDQAMAADDKRWAEALKTMAEMLNVSLPSEAGLRLYFLVLRKVPGSMLNLACSRVAEKHRFNTMPKPADFLDAIAVENSRLRILLTVTETAMRNVGRALSNRQKEEADAAANG